MTSPLLSMTLAGLLVALCTTSTSTAAVLPADECDERSHDCCPLGERFPTIDVDEGDAWDCFSHIRIPYMP